MTARNLSDPCGADIKIVTRGTCGSMTMNLRQILNSIKVSQPGPLPKNNS